MSPSRALIGMKETSWISSFLENCTNSAYLTMCKNLSDSTYCFGCVGLAKKDFYILNIGFNRKEYFELTKRLKKELGVR